MAELNAIAAELMILKWKRMLGFYGDMTAVNDENFIFAVQENAVFNQSESHEEGN